MKNVGVWLLLLSVSMSLTACGPRDARYYREHPKALQEAIAECPARAPALVDCDALHQIAIQVNEYVYELRMSPQGFGKTILSLQETIAKQASSQQADHESLLDKNTKALKERLAIVNWLESPAS